MAGASSTRSGRRASSAVSSRRPAGSARSRSASGGASAPVIGIDVDVAMGEVAGPYARLALADPYVDGDVELAALHVGGDRRFVIAGSRTALLGDHRAAHRHRHAEIGRAHV